MIQFKGRTIDVLAPAANSIKERELVINTAEPALYTSSDGSDVVKLTGNISNVYDPTKVYENGDMIVVGDDIYVVTDETLVVVGNIPPAAGWALATPDEKGGIAYDGIVAYVPGDAVTQDNRIYINLVACTGTAPTPGGNANWNDTIVSGSYVGQFTPTVGDEYPDALTDGASQNDFYIVNGLGSGVTYTMTGPPLAGTIVKDSDRFIAGIGFDDEGSMAGSWNYVPGPTIPSEQGGIIWSSATTYAVGDIVADNTDGNIYVAIGVSTGAQPNAVPTSWKHALDDIIDYEVGGVAWKVGIDYLPGVIVSEGNSSWICLAAHTSLTGDNPDGSPTKLNQINWLKTLADVEAINDIGDVDTLTDSPVVGDVLMWDGTNWVPMTKSVIDIISGADQAIFPVVYNPVNVEIFVNGIKINPSEYTATNGTSVTFDTDQKLDSWVQVISTLSM